MASQLGGSGNSIVIGTGLASVENCLMGSGLSSGVVSGLKAAEVMKSFGEVRA